jgi:hypothetical protein
VFTLLDPLQDVGTRAGHGGGYGGRTAGSPCGAALVAVQVESHERRTRRDPKKQSDLIPLATDP